MTPDAPRNLPASVRRRLLNRARDRGEDFNYLLTRYANERLLYRLSRSRHAGEFVLKGATLFELWNDAATRATRDVDLLGFGEPGTERLRLLFRELCTIDVAADGLRFLEDTVRASPIRDRDAYGGIRVRMTADLDGARIAVQVDIGFGDAVTPPARESELPTLLDFPAPRLRAYPPETVVAEKFEAIVHLGLANSRMKDFYDLWVIARTFPFEGPVLAAALRATFGRRRTPLRSTPLAFTPEFAAEASKRAQWSAFRDRTGLAAGTSLDAVVDELKEFLMPVVSAIAEERAFVDAWKPGGPWAPG